MELASKFGVLELIGTLSMRAFYPLPSLSNLSDCSEIILITRLGFQKKRQTKYVHCVHCVLAVLIKQTDPFYDFAVGDKWMESEKMRTMSKCVCNPRPSTDELNTL